MNLKPLLKPLLLHTGLLALLTVGAVYLATHSGLYMLALAGSGVVLAALGGGAAGQTNFGSNAEEAELVADGTGFFPEAITDGSLRFVLLFYGVGVLVWSIVVLSTLGDTLV
ncbi:hypothetical protein ACFPYI_07500 [Halomarina salina]|uniref:DUF8070 domain-containing protein n=1 Tax=Halomarina salina TaxID=1872699 RepID=A0ABD5RLA4_9EURY|nr:hypothetical protein [Halomarina salina]